MLEIQQGDGQTVVLSGRLDAAQAERAQAFLDAVQPPCVLDLHGLEYISSAGLGVLLKTHKRLFAGGGIRLVNVNPHVLDIFRYSGMDKLFAVEARPRE
ncbi:MAG: STAS domain-containing protein [Thermomonas sp.]